ncbi:kinase-like domain-containing protein [Aspergillus varians]
MRAFSRLFPRLPKSTARSMSTRPSRDLFEYTSGRFLFNEQLRCAERHVQFNVDALSSVVCRAVSRPATELTSIVKIAEGGFNRVLQVTFNDGYAVIARIPFKSTVPKHYAVASEAATLHLLRSKGIPVPKVLTYSPDPANPVGAEYIILEKIEGTPLSDQWFTMDNKSRVKIMKQIVQVESRFMSIHFPASGSLYYRRDLERSQCSIPLPEETELDRDEIVVGPTAQHEWWYKDRVLLDINRGPWTNYRSSFEAPANREIEFCRQFGKPRLHVERYLRELHQFQKLSPSSHIQLLSDYLKLSPSLELRQNHPFSRPTLRHPDFSPNNILINTSNDISGVIDWQHAAILPLCLCAGIPDHFQNWGDPVSETLAKPDVKLPENLHELSEDEQQAVLETRRKRLIHFYYAALTMSQMPDHFDALRNENSMLRAKLFKRAGAPWEGDSLSLKYAILQACTNWPMFVEGDSHSELGDCPVQFSEEEAQSLVKDHDAEGDKMRELSEMRDMIGIDAQGWVPDDEQLQRAKDIAQQIKEGLLAESSTDLERKALLLHFPFDDHDED